MILEETFERHALTPDKARVYLTTDQLNLTSGVATKVLIASETYDLGENFNTANNRFTAKRDGYFQVNAALEWKAASVVAEKRYKIHIYVDGAEVAATTNQSSLAGNAISNTISDVIFVPKDSFIELYATQITGVNTVDIEGGEAITYMSIHLISE